MRVLLAEADVSLAILVQGRFHEKNYSVDLVGSGSALSCVRDESMYDLLLIDLNLPGIAGLACLPDLQRRWPDVPIILMSDYDSVEERVAALNSGADDFIAKPFALTELVARTQAVIRRHGRHVGDVYQFEDLEINRVTHGVSRAGRAIELTPREYAVLELLLRNPGQPVSRRTIIDQAFCRRAHPITNIVDVYVNYLRAKMDAGSDRQMIRTVRGVGYQIGGNHFSTRQSEELIPLETR